MRYILAALILLIDGFGYAAYASDAAISVYFKSDIGDVNPNIFGTNVLGYDPLSYETLKSDTVPYYGFSDYGAGLWDPQKKIPVPEAVDLAHSAGISAARYPGGCGSHNFDWKETVGKDRTRFLFGLDEFLDTCASIGAVPLITVSYFTGDASDAADLVEYLNAPNDKSNPGGGIDWAQERANNGHAHPYNVKYFEIGNEVWHGDHRKIPNVRPQDYAKSFLTYYDAIRAVDSSAQVGIALNNPDWNKKVLEQVKTRADFGILHVYPTPAWGDGLAGYRASDIFKISLALPSQECARDFLRTRALAQKMTGHALPLAVTEYNAGFVQDLPVPYRFSLMAALVNAELLKVFLAPGNNIFMANYWNFINEYWGMVANGFDGTQRTLYNRYYKRPAYYVYSLYHEHFGTQLLDTKVESEHYLYRMQPVPYLSVNSSKSSSGNKVYLMVINKNLKFPVTATITLHDFGQIAAVNAWVLNGSSIDATNESYHDDVGIRERSAAFAGEGPGDIFRFTFEPHSLTAIEVDGAK